MRLSLSITTLADTVFARGDGLSGAIDVEVAHDSVTGLPFIPGRTIKGLLVEECANLLDQAASAAPVAAAALTRDAAFLFGVPGSSLDRAGHLNVSRGLLPPSITRAAEHAVERGLLTPAQLLDSVTTVRARTAEDARTGAPLEGSLRSERVILRGISFVSTLEIDAPDEEARASVPLLAACCRLVRRAGLGRSRGRGWIRCELLDSSGKAITGSAVEDLVSRLHSNQA